MLAFGISLANIELCLVKSSQDGTKATQVALYGLSNENFNKLPYLTWFW